MINGNLIMKPDTQRSPHWPAVRTVWLHIHNTCAGCGGKLDLEVHHKQPYHLFPALELDPTNFITLCEHPSRNCHYRLGHGFNWHAFIPTVEEDAKYSLSRISSKQE